MPGAGHCQPAGSGCAGCEHSLTMKLWHQPSVATGSDRRPAVCMDWRAATAQSRTRLVRPRPPRPRADRGACAACRRQSGCGSRQSATQRFSAPTQPLLWRTMRADAGGEILVDMRLAVPPELPATTLRQPSKRPYGRRRTYPYMPTRLKSIAGAKRGSLRHRVDGAETSGGSLLPAIGAGLAGVGAICRHDAAEGDDKPSLTSARADRHTPKHYRQAVRGCHLRRPLLRAVANGASTTELSSNGPRCTFCSVASVRNDQRDGRVVAA